ncbi:hypothetical protein BU17DRAFT_64207 [Hysterangium stoloniferum]|nr:hypothetical protein BU17DRAFT_64207 [Hysterangium stoloniferum]
MDKLTTTQTQTQTGHLNSDDHMVDGTKAMDKDYYGYIVFKYHNSAKGKNLKREHIWQNHVVLASGPVLVARFRRKIGKVIIRLYFMVTGGHLWPMVATIVQGDHKDFDGEKGVSREGMPSKRSVQSEKEEQLKIIE